MDYVEVGIIIVTSDIMEKRSEMGSEKLKDGEKSCLVKFGDRTIVIGLRAVKVIRTPSEWVDLLGNTFAILIVL